MSSAAASDAPLLEGEDLHHRYPGAETDALRGVSLSSRAGTLTTVVGPNGSGKSTLLRLLAGGLNPRLGSVRFADRPVAEWSRRALARELAVVTQHEHLPFPVTVRELVAMGRYAHLGPWRREAEADRAAIAAAMERCGVAGLEHRLAQSLSGGEMQRARLARALAQQPRALVLDEPTAGLDVRFEMTTFRLLRDLADRDRTAVVTATHNLNLAARFGDRHLLLNRGREAAQGDADSVFTEARLSATYDWPVSVVRRDFTGGPAPQMEPR